MSSRRLLISGFRPFRSLHNGSAFNPIVDYEARVRPYFQFEKIRPDCFQSSHLTSPVQGSVKAAYGGLLFAQSLATAEITVPDNVHLGFSNHSYFIRNVDTQVPVQYNIRRLRDGSSFFTRSVEAVQQEKIVFSAQISFHKKEPESCVHQVVMPKVLHWSELSRAKEAIPQMIESLHKKGFTIPQNWLKWTKKYIDAEQLFDTRLIMPSEALVTSFWFRTVGNLPKGDKMHKYLLAYITDAEMAISVLRPHLFNRFQPSMIFSLDHWVWFHSHTDFRADNWFLIEVESPKAAGSRGLANSRIFSEEGQLILSATQEVLIRSRGQSSRLP